eukprot:1821027-Amphidinium_carterae.4
MEVLPCLGTRVQALEGPQQAARLNAQEELNVNVVLGRMWCCGTGCAGVVSAEERSLCTEEWWNCVRTPGPRQDVKM